MGTNRCPLASSARISGGACRRQGRGIHRDVRQFETADVLRAEAPPPPAGGSGGGRSGRSGRSGRGAGHGGGCGGDGGEGGGDGIHGRAVVARAAPLVEVPVDQ